MAWLQKSVGTSVSILTDTHTRLPHLETKWITSIRTYLGTINSHLNLTVIPMTTLQRQHDPYIMDTLLLMRLRPAEVRQINFCRLFLNATLISDITTANGKAIKPHATHGIEITSPVKDEAIKQAKPFPPTWAAWRRFLRVICHPGNKLLLKQPLDHWKVSFKDL